MSLGDWADKVFGSKGEIDWNALAKLMELDVNLNRTDRGGPFTGWEWEKDAEGNPTSRQSMVINPAFQGAVDRLGNRASGESPMITSQMPDQMQQIYQASMANQGHRYGLPPAPPSGGQVGGMPPTTTQPTDDDGY